MAPFSFLDGQAHCKSIKARSFLSCRCTADYQGVMCHRVNSTGRVQSTCGKMGDSRVKVALTMSRQPHKHPNDHLRIVQLDILVSI